MEVTLPKDQEVTVNLTKVNVMQHPNNVKIKYKIQGEDGWFTLQKGFYKLPAKTIVLKADAETKVVLQPAE